MLKTEALIQIPYLAPLRQNQQILTKIAKTLIEESYDAGQILFLEGEPCKGAYFLVQGRIRIFKSEPGGKEQVLRIIPPKATFNEVPVFDGGTTPASAEALEPSTVWILPCEVVVELMEQEPLVSRTIIKILATRLRQLTALVAEISLKQVTARVARLLLDYAEEEAVLGAGVSNQIVGQLTQQQMAAMAGTVRDMVGRSLRTIQKAGAIEAKRGYIIIKDSNKLRTFI